MQEASQQAGAAIPGFEPLDQLMQTIAEHKSCGTHGGSGKASCGSAAGQGDLAPEIWEKVKNRPCYSEETHHHYARMHVAVAPACNIQCKHCNRKFARSLAKLLRTLVIGTVLGAFCTGAWAEEAGGQADPQTSIMAQPSMLGPLVANPKPTSFDAGPLGKTYVTGVASALGQTQNVVAPGDKSSQADISNAQVIIQKPDGLFQFYAQAGAYSLPALGVPYMPATMTTDQFFGPLPVAFVKLAPTDSFSIQAGKLPTLIGAEVTFNFEDSNIQRGLLWNQENAVNRGIQVNYATGPLSLSLALTDGLYSNRLSWLIGSATYKFDASNMLTFIAGGNTQTDTTNTMATPVLQNNEQIYNLIYMYSSGPWLLTPYLQYTYVPKRPAIGMTRDASTLGSALIVCYSLETAFGLTGVNLPVRFEYIQSTGNPSDSTPNLLYGPGSKAWSITATPTYQRNIFFARAEFSYVGTANTTPGLVFGPNGNDRTQFRGLLETGIIF